MEKQVRDYSYFLAYHGYKNKLISKLLDDVLIHYNVSRNLTDVKYCIYSGEFSNINTNSFALHGRASNLRTTKLSNKSFIQCLLFFVVSNLLRRNNSVDINTFLLLATLVDYCNPEYISQIKNIVNEVPVDVTGRIRGPIEPLGRKCLAITNEFIEKKKNSTILDITKFLDMLLINGLSSDTQYRLVKLFNMERYEKLKTNGKLSILSLYDGRLSKSYTYNKTAMFGSVFVQERDATVAKIRDYIHNDLNECIANDCMHESKLYKTIVRFLNSPHTKSEYYIPMVIAFNRLIKTVLEVDLSSYHLSSMNNSSKIRLQFISEFLNIDEITHGKNVRDKYTESSLSIAKEHAIADMKLGQVLHDWFNL